MFCFSLDNAEYTDSPWSGFFTNARTHTPCCDGRGCAGQLGFKQKKKKKKDDTVYTVKGS